MICSIVYSCVAQVCSPLVNRDLGGDPIAPVIRNGRPDKGMPGLLLPDNTIPASAVTRRQE